MAKRASLSYDKSWYTPQNIKQQIKAGKEKEVRAEYTRLRDISQKRLKRLKAAGYEDTQLYKQNAKRFKELKDIKSQSELSRRLSDLSRFIDYKGSTVTGQKQIMKKSLKTLHTHGYTFVNASNYKEFGLFMEEYRNNMLDMEYDSGEAADLFGVVTRRKIPIDKVKEDFELWLSQHERAEKMADLYFTLQRFHLQPKDFSDDIDFMVKNVDILKKMRADAKAISNPHIIKQRMQKHLKAAARKGRG